MSEYCAAAGLLFCLLATLTDAAAVSARPNSPPGPTFLSQPGLFRVREGDAVLLPCTVARLGKHSVVWTQGKRVLTARHLIVDSDSRLSLVDDYNLRIDRVTLQDAANFTCSVSSKPMIELTHTVDVLYGPVVTTVPASGLLAATQGQNVTLECSAEGNPLPRIGWRRRHGHLPSGEDRSPGRLLHIRRVSREMAGVYECVAENGLGTPGMASVSVRVQYPPDVRMERTTVHTGERRRLQVVCSVFADPPAQVSWERRGSAFEGPRHLTFNEASVGTRHVLNIHSVKDTDFGTYVCKARNYLGQANATVQISGVADRAVIISGAISTAPELYELSWEVESFSPVTEYRVAYRPAGTNGSGLSPARWREVKVPPTGSRTSSGVLYRQQIPLAGLQPATAYELYVQAKNKHGWNAVSDMLHFSTIARGEALESRSASGGARAPRRGLRSGWLLVVVFIILPVLLDC